MNIVRFFENTLENNPNKVFLKQEIERDGEYFYNSLTYREFYKSYMKVASALSPLNIGGVDRVAIILSDPIEIIVAWFAVNLIGGTAVILESALTYAESQKQLRHIEPKLVIDPLTMSSMRRESSVEEIAYSLKENPIATIVYSSGTTGEPKGVLVTHKTYIMCGEAFPWWLGLKADDVLYTCLSLAHINAQAYSVMGTIGLGATLVLGSKFNKGENFWKKISASGATQFNALGGMLRDLWHQPYCYQENFHSVAVIANGQAIPDPEWHYQLEQRFGARVVISYGSSESPFGGFVVPLNTWRRGYNNVGKRKLHPTINPNQFGALLFFDQGLAVSQPNQVGELWVHNPAISPGYWRNPQLTAEKFHQGGYYTGDLFYFDTCGYYYFMGRKDNIIRVGGNLVSPEEVEGILNQHPAVAESAVVGPKDKFGEAVLTAHIVWKNGESVIPDDLIEFCKTKLAAYKIPQRWRFPKELPKTETGKLQRGQLI